MIFSEKFEVAISLHYRVHDAEIYGFLPQLRDSFW